MPNNNTTRTNTSTQIRNFYSDEMSYLNVSFYNTNLSLKFYPFISKDNLGKSNYDMNNGEQTTVNFEGADALFQTADDIIKGKINEVKLPIPCASGASLELERIREQDGSMGTYLHIDKNNRRISFKFATMIRQIKEGNKVVDQVIETGLGAFRKTVDGYLTGINADRHLNKLTDDFVKAQQGQQQQGGQSQGNNNGNNRNNYQINNYKKPYNSNNNGYKKPYNNYNNNRNNNWNPPNQQNMSSFTMNN